MVGRILRCPVKVGLRGAGGFAVFGSVPTVAVFEEFGGHQTFVLVAFVVGSCDAAVHGLVFVLIVGEPLDGTGDSSEELPGMLPRRAEVKVDRLLDPVCGVDFPTVSVRSPVGVDWAWYRASMCARV